VARHWFLGDLAAWALDIGADETSINAQAGKRALLLPSGNLTFWSGSTGGTQLTDLLDNVGSPITSVTADSVGEFPQVQGPDTDPETWWMWADGNGGAGPRRLVVATDVGDVVGNLSSGLTDLASDVSDLSALVSMSLGVVSYDSGTLSWPTRPTDSRVYAWIGPTAPPVGGAYMADGKDIWINTTPAS
jgi:hypothetical protein